MVLKPVGEVDCLQDNICNHHDDVLYICGMDHGMTEVTVTSWLTSVAAMLPYSTRTRYHVGEKGRVDGWERGGSSSKRPRRSPPHHGPGGGRRGCGGLISC